MFVIFFVLSTNFLRLKTYCLDSSVTKILLKHNDKLYVLNTMELMRPNKECTFQLISIFLTLNDLDQRQ